MVDDLSGWLALREPADIAARSRSLTQAMVNRLPRERPLRLLDLGAGTGSNIRCLTEYLTPAGAPPGDGQEWLAVDREAALLARVPAYVETRCEDLGALDHPGLFAGRHLVTASALLDLVSAAWIARLAGRCRTAGASVLFALNYDGRSACSPREPEDGPMLELFNRHQKRSDKGFGRAAGPDAASCAVRCFTEAGYHVEHACSDWALAPESRALQRRLIEGWAQAVREVAPERSDEIGCWLARRLAHVSAGRSRVMVGHQDIAAWLPR